MKMVPFSQTKLKCLHKNPKFFENRPTRIQRDQSVIFSSCSSANWMKDGGGTCAASMQKRVVLVSGQHDIVLCHFQDVEVGEPQLILRLMSLQDDHPAARSGEKSESRAEFHFIKKFGK